MKPLGTSRNKNDTSSLLMKKKYTEFFQGTAPEYVLTNWNKEGWVAVALLLQN